MSLIWLDCLRSIGWRLKRSSEVFASWDGEGQLTLGLAAELDPDDHLGQLILHELCHALIEGTRGRHQIDWGLENIDQRHLVNEFACHRLQAYFADQYGLRGLFAVTTDWRPYFDQIPAESVVEQTDGQLVQWATLFGISVSEARSLDVCATYKFRRFLSEESPAPAQEVSDRVIIHHIHRALAKSKALANVMADLSLKDTLWNLA